MNFTWGSKEGVTKYALYPDVLHLTMRKSYGNGLTPQSTPSASLGSVSCMALRPCVLPLLGRFQAT